jgi:hypothetical protein
MRVIVPSTLCLPVGWLALGLRSSRVVWNSQEEKEFERCALLLG